MRAKALTNIHIILPFREAELFKKQVENPERKVVYWNSLPELMSQSLEPRGVHILVAADRDLNGCHRETVTFILGLRIVVLLTGNEVGKEEYWIRRGCMGVLRDDAPLSTAINCLLSVEQGQIWASRGILSLIVRQHVSSNFEPMFTRREGDILGLKAAGRSNHKIAEDLCISRDTVRWHLRSIYKKSGVSGRREAARILTARYRSMGGSFEAAPSNPTDAR